MYRGEIIPGVEITTIYDGEVVEVLGYGFSVEKMKELLHENVYSFYDKQIAEAKLNLETFKRYGVRLSKNFEQTMLVAPEILFDANKTSSRGAFLDEIKKHPENISFFDSEEQMNEITLRDFSRNIVYNPKSSLYVNQSSLYPSLDTTIEMIHMAGGVAFLAHLYEYSSTIAIKIEDIIRRYNLDGLECYYTTFTKEQSKFLVKLCKEYNLYKSCGSDFHGYKVKPNNYMGKATNGEKMEKSIISDWIGRINNKLNILSEKEKFGESLKYNNKVTSIITKNSEKKKKRDNSMEL